MSPPTKKLKKVADAIEDNSTDVSDSLLINQAMHQALKMPETLAIVFNFLSVSERGRAAQVCLKWRAACNHSSVWRDAKCTLLPGRPFPSDILKQRRIRKFKITGYDSPSLLQSTAMQLFASFPDLYCLEFDGCSALTDAVLLEILPPSGLPLVTQLVFRKCENITDDSVELVTRLFPNLRFLDFDRCRIPTDTALLCISLRLRRLQHLNLTRCRLVTQKGIGYLAGHIDQHDTVALNFLQQLRGPISHEDKDNLTSTNDHQDLTHLPITNLNLFGCQLVTDEALHHLSRMKELRSLGLTYCQNVSDVGIGHLTNLPKLCRLHLQFCHQVGDDGLAHLAQMSGLLELNLRGCPNLTIDGLLALTRRKPKITSLDLSSCNSLRSKTLDQIADGLLELRSLRLEHYHTTDASLDSVGLKLPLLTDFQVRGDNGTWEIHQVPSCSKLDL